MSPGHVDTNFIRSDSAHSPNSWETSIENPDNYERRRASTPLGRLCLPEDIAKTFLFAASDEAAMITGSMITVDGGAGIWRRMARLALRHQIANTTDHC